MLPQLALPLAAQEVHLCPENPPEDHLNFVRQIEQVIDQFLQSCHAYTGS